MNIFFYKIKKNTNSCKKGLYPGTVIRPIDIAIKNTAAYWILVVLFLCIL